MKLRQGFIQRKIAGESILIPIGAENIGNFNGVINLNTSAAYVCSLLKEEQTRESLVQSLLEKYEVSEEVASKDVDQLLKVMREHQMIEE